MGKIGCLGIFRRALVLAGIMGGVLLWPYQTYSAEARNVRLIGHNDLQGRDNLQIVLKGNFAYIGHHRGEALNPLTGKTDPNGTSIVDVSDPRQPKVVAHIPGRRGAESRAAQVAIEYFDGKDYLLRNQESGEFTGFEIWDVTEKANPRWSPLSAAFGNRLQAFGKRGGLWTGSFFSILES